MPRQGPLLMEMYEAMRTRLGHQGWWPGETKLEICLGAILTQNTNWTNVEKALANLRQASCLDLGCLHRLPHEALANLIRPAGYYNIKARRLKNFIAHVHERFGENLEAFLARPASTLREELLEINGIGRETADSIVLYAAGHCSFVVDAYTYRILLRHNLIAPEDDYEAIKELFETALPCDAGLYNDYHAQLVAVGKQYCRPQAQCEQCPLNAFPHDPKRGREECVC